MLFAHVDLGLALQVYLLLGLLLNPVELTDQFRADAAALGLVVSSRFRGPFGERACASASSRLCSCVVYYKPLEGHELGCWTG